LNVYRDDPRSWNEERIEYAVAVGVFDGVHRGHMAVFDALRVAAAGLPLCALTFGTHPDVIVNSESIPKLLTTLDRRIELLEAAGLDAVGVIDFDDEIRHLSPDDFVSMFLTGGLNASLVAVGRGFRFGYRAAGTVGDLRLMGQREDFDVVETQIVNLHGTEVRSSSIRAAIASGSVELAARMLGRPFEIEGLVVPGDARGRTIGFPTANITMPDGLVRPAGGVYAVRCTVDGTVIDGVANVGTRPTFGGGDETIEVHLYDTTMDLYGKTVRVSFIDRIRNEQRFASVDALVSQINADIDVAKAIFSHLG
jgi:riboflavin kinase / FMN adenylyltransferase